MVKHNRHQGSLFELFTLDYEQHQELQYPTLFISDRFYKQGWVRLLTYVIFVAAFSCNFCATSIQVQLNCSNCIIVVKSC